MTTYDELDAVIEEVSLKEVDLTAFYQAQSDSIPVVTQYLTDRDTTLLSHEEHDYMLFLGVIVLKCAVTGIASTQEMTPQHIEEHEELLWGIVNEYGSQLFTKLEEHLTPDDVVQEFLIESLERDKDTAFLTDEGALLIFVKLSVVCRHLGLL